MRNDVIKLLKESRIDALWIMGSGQENPYMDYLTDGAMLVHADLFIRENAPDVLLHSPMERDEAEKTDYLTDVIHKYFTKEILQKANGDPVKKQILMYASILRELQLDHAKIGVCGKIELGKSYDLLAGLQNMLSETEICGSEGNKILDQAMLTKDEREADRIRNLGLVTEKISIDLVCFLGSHKVKENKLVKEDGDFLTIGDVKQKINLWAAENSTRIALDLILSIGRDAGVPHNPGNNADIFELGKTIVMDIVIGELHGGYKHDFTRTWCLGYAEPEVAQAYEQVKEIQLQVIADLKNDTLFVQYQNQVCDYFEGHGHQTIRKSLLITSGYVHSLGHGIGLRVHEKPFCNIASKDMIEKGNIFTIEPGLYYPEKGFGIRIEDTIYAAPNGQFEIFNNSPKELVIEMS